jgi:hypothetical protein
MLKSPRAAAPGRRLRHLASLVNIAVVDRLKYGDPSGSDMVEASRLLDVNASS